MTHSSPCLPCCLVPFSTPFPAQDVFTQAFLNPPEVLGSYCQGGRWDGAGKSSFTALFGQQHYVLLSPNFYCNIFFCLWLFYLPGKLGATGLFRLALETVSKVSHPESTASQAGQLLTETPDQLSCWLCFFLLFAAPNQLDAQNSSQDAALEQDVV